MVRGFLIAYAGYLQDEMSNRITAENRVTKSVWKILLCVMLPQKVLELSV